MICSDATGFVNVLLSNRTGTTHKIEKGTLLGLAYEAELMASTSDTPALLELKNGEPTSQTHSHCHALPIYSVHAATVECCKQNLVQSIAEAGVDFPWQDKSKLLKIICEYHTVFALEEGERRETGIVQMKIDTGEAAPKHQHER